VLEVANDFKRDNYSPEKELADFKESLIKDNAKDLAAQAAKATDSMHTA